MKKLFIIAFVICIGMLHTNSVSAQVGPGGGTGNSIFGLGFSKVTTVWWPLESADYNAGFKSAFNDIDAFTTYLADVGTVWVQETVNGKTQTVAKQSLQISGPAYDDLLRMIQVYYDRSENPLMGNQDYRRGLYEAASTWSSICLYVIVPS
ncbi:hypothetical protein IM793_19550 [Pedobacter sp. MR2016-19]|uniref:hypothetical protein n=1 Tax=Pedobacter sp. MR2016-19 TaxID=2780089 RepID=UPI0018774275|nr:hypothetical protein [Pedobacter sp. MR2016-19]MBE5321367.1 hypothetical protein [Pedobacter sp. MR2016-19]